MINNISFKIIILSILSAFLITSYAKNIGESKVIDAALFSKMDLTGWKNKKFKDETKYTFIEENQKYFLQASSMQSASALYKKIKVDPESTPYLNWSWRIDQPLPTLNELKKTGDDFAARVYVVFKTGFTPLSARAINYVWASQEPEKASWQNPFTNKAIMIPLRTNTDAPNAWQYEKVNIKEDLLKHFGVLPKFIKGVAIMTDSDNSMNVAKASYGDIYFSNE